MEKLSNQEETRPDINSLKMFIASADLEKIEKENSSNASFLFFSFWLLGTSKCGKSSISDSHNSQITEFEEEKCLSKDPTLYHPHSRNTTHFLNNLKNQPHHP